jgi:hypothetical protein
MSEQGNLFEELEDQEFLDAEMEAEAQRLHDFELEMWAILDEEREQEEQDEFELWAYVEELNEAEHDEELSIWFEIWEEEGIEMAQFSG